MAHNCSADQSLLDAELPGIEASKWMCSYRGVDWKDLLGVKSASQETLMGRAGFQYEQDHHAGADAIALVEVLSQKDASGRTFLARLLDGESHGSTSVTARA